MSARPRRHLRGPWAIAAVAAVLTTTGGPRGAAESEAQALTAGVSPDSISGVSGQTWQVALQANMGTSGVLLSTYSVSIVWDSTVVRLDSLRSGSFGTPLVNYSSGGEVRLTQVNSTGLGGAFSLAQLHFRFVNDTIGKRTPIAVTFGDFVSTDLVDLRESLGTISGVARILAPTVVVTFTPDSIRERVGFRPQMDLTADLSQASGVALGSYVTTVTWNPSIMLLESVTAGDFTAPEINLVSTGELRLSAAAAAGRGGAPFSLARLHFRFVSETFPSETPLTLSVTEMRAAVTFANLLPGVSALNGKALIGGVLRGDIDVNGSIAALDAQLILQGVVGLALPGGLPGLPHGDADCGGTLQARDAQIVLHQVVGNPVAQFCVARIQ